MLYNPGIKCSAMEKDIEETIKSYDRNAERYSKTYNLAYIEKQLKFYVENFKGKRILDIGCGPGRDAAYFSEKGFEVVGIDLSEELLKIARKNSPNLEFYIQDMRNLGFEPDSFDGIWACSSFMHAPYKDARSTLRGFNRILKPDGLMFLCVLEGEGERMEKTPRFFEDNRFFAYYSEECIESLIDNADFRTISCEVEAKPRGNWINLFCRKR